MENLERKESLWKIHINEIIIFILILINVYKLNNINLNYKCIYL